ARGAAPLRARDAEGARGRGAPLRRGGGRLREDGVQPELRKDRPGVAMTPTSPFDPNAAAGPDSGVYGLPHTPDQARVVVVPVPFEATCSYGGGTANGPAALLHASRQVDLFDVETGRPYEDGIAMLPEPGDVRRWDEEARRLAGPIIAAGGAKPGDPALDAVNALCDR